MGPGANPGRGVDTVAAYDGGVRTGWILSVATAFVLLGASIAAFLNPIWVGFEQARAGVGQGVVLQTSQGGCAIVDVDRITGSILHDLVLGGDFGVSFGEKVRQLVEWGMMEVSNAA